MENDDETETLLVPGNDPPREYRHLGGCHHPVPVGPVTRGKGKPGLWRRLCQLVKPDWLFALLLLFAIGLVALSHPGTGESAVSPVPPFPKLLFLFGIVFFMALFATFGAALDRRKLDDYYFQLMANGAIIAVITTLLTNVIWGLLDGMFPSLSANELTGVLTASWSLGYFFYRFRGLKA